MSTLHADILVLDRSRVPLAAALKDPGPVFSAVGLGAFAGRDWLAAEVDEFIAANRCGYVFIEAEAGLGKTAFAAWLVKTRGYLSHFARYAEGSSVAGALGNLSAQLIIRFGLNDLAPGGMLPEWARTPGGFESLLAAAAQTTQRREPVVLVADGLDEAEAPDGGLPFGLPPLLPDGVFVIGTYRTGRAPRRPDATARVVQIGRHDPRNRRDIDQFLAAAAEEVVLAARLAEAGADPAGFTAVLAERCGGVWVYLRYVLDELRIGLRHPDEVSGLPAGLHSYYADQVRRWQQDPAWQSGLLPLLAALGAAGEPLTAATLARLAGGLDLVAVQRWCDLTARPLLATTHPSRAGSPLQYEIYHASFRELLAGAPADRPGSPDGQGYELVALASELGHATAAAHSRISDAYLAYFGGLAAGLPVLAGDPGAAGVDGGYPLRHLVRHLCAAGRAGELHALLAAEHPAAGEHAVNTWFAAHDHSDTGISYLADLARARAESATDTDRDLSSGRPAPSLGMEIRYALMAASIADIAGKVPTELMGHLIRTGVWSPRRGLDHAQRITDPPRRISALLVVCGQLGTEDQADVLADALAAAAITDDSERAKALTALAPHLPADLLAQALAAATAITSEYDRAEALTGLAPHLPADLLAQALAATAITDGFYRVRVLARLASHLPGAVHPAVVAQALAAATATTDEYFRAEYFHAWMQLGPTPHLPDADQRAVVAQALAAATAITSEYDRVRALTGLAPHLPADLLAQALAAATDSSRAWVLAGLAPHLPDADQSAVVAQALAAATAIRDDSARAEALTGLAPHLPADLLAQALAAATATAITSNYHRARALTGLAPHLPADLLAQALAAATAITSDSERVQALAALAPHLPEADQHAVVAQALAAATAITSNYHRARALVALAPHLPADLLVQALAAATATTISNFHRSRVLTALAPHLPEAHRHTVVAQALVAATAITFDPALAEALTGLAPHLPEADQRGAVTIALAAATDSAEALAALAPHLPADLLAQALAAAITNRSDRAEVLAALAPHLPADLLDRALTAAAAITSDSERAEALTGLAPHLPADLLDRALTAAAAITSDFWRARALTGLAPHLPEADQHAVVIQALAAATAARGSARVEALAALAPHLPEAHRRAVVAQALPAAIACNYDRARALAALAPHLPAKLLAQALAAAAAITSDSERARALTGLAPHLPADLLAQALKLAPSDEQALVTLLERAQSLHTQGTRLPYLVFLRDCLTGIDRSLCLGILATVVPSIAAFGGTTAIRQVADSVTDTCRWWP